MKIFCSEHWLKTMMFPSNFRSQMIQEMQMKKFLIVKQIMKPFIFLKKWLWTCHECVASFPDEFELYYEIFWFNHRSNVCNLKYKGLISNQLTIPIPSTSGMCHVLTVGHIIWRVVLESWSSVLASPQDSSFSSTCNTFIFLLPCNIVNSVTAI